MKLYQSKWSTFGLIVPINENCFILTVYGYNVLIRITHESTTHYTDPLGCLSSDFNRIIVAYDQNYIMMIAEYREKVLEDLSKK